MSTHPLALDPIDRTPNPTPPPTLTSLPSMSTMSYGLLVFAVIGTVMCTVGLVRRRTSGPNSDTTKSQSDTTRKLVATLVISLVNGVLGVAGVILL